MNQLGIVSPNPPKLPTIGVIYNNGNNVNFRANNNQTQQDRFEAILQEEEKRQKAAKREKRFSQFMQFGIFAAIVASTVAFIKFSNPKNATKGIEQSKEELDKIWQDVSKECNLSDLALPDSLKNFTNKFKRHANKADIIKKRGGKPVKTVLLYGPPGTGKTSYAMAIAKEFPNSEFATIDMTTLDSAFKSVGDKNLKNAIDNICKKADENPNKKIFVFLDEIDSIMMVDNSLNAADSNKTLNVFKRELNNLKKRDNILVIGATNLSIDAVEKGMMIGGKRLDSAMLNRFNAKVLVDLPNADQIAGKVVRNYTSAELAGDSLKNLSDKNLKTLCEFFSKPERNVSFRDIENVIDDAAAAFEADTDKVELMDLVQAIKNRQAEYHFTDAEFGKLLQDLKIDPSKVR